jgi:hypothetical protein
MYAAGTHAIGSSIRLEALLFVRSGKSLQKNWNSQLFIHRASLGSLVQKMPGGKERHRVSALLSMSPSTE